MYGAAGVSGTTVIKGGKLTVSSAGPVQAGMILSGGTVALSGTADLRPARRSILADGGAHRLGGGTFVKFT